MSNKIRSYKRSHACEMREKYIYLLINTCHDAQLEIINNCK